MDGMEWQQWNKKRTTRQSACIQHSPETQASYHLLSGVEAFFLVVTIEIPAISILLLFSVRSNINYILKFTSKNKSSILGKTIHIIIHFYTVTTFCIDHNCSFSGFFILWIAFLAISQLCESFSELTQYSNW